MGRGFQGAALRHLTRLFEAGTLAAASDRELLDEFANRRDESAFEAIVTRYGRLVLNVGRKLLRDPGDVEDAFQATFLVLVRKPPRLRVGESLAPWLSTVAYRVAARARANRIRLNRLESTSGVEPASLPTDDSNALALHEEVGRLPDRLRRPVVFCYLEGLTHERAAERLGCPVGTVRSRLARARSLLHRRLLARGVAPVVAPIEALLASSRPVEPSFGLMAQTLRLATASHVRWPEAGVASASLISLVNGVVRIMKLKKALVAFSLLFPVGILAAAGAQAYQQASDGPDRIVVGGKTYVAEPEEPETIPKTYYVGDLVIPPSTAGQRTESSISFEPVIRLLTRHVAPGTWKVQDNAGTDISTLHGLAQNSGGDADRRIGSIMPFYLSISLIVRHTKETHEQIASLLEDVRNVVHRTSPEMIQALDQASRSTPVGKARLENETRESPINLGGTTKPTKANAPREKEQGSGKPFHPRTSSDLAIEQLTRKSPTLGKINESRPATKYRLRQLLNQLQSELDSLDAEDATTPVQSTPLKGDLEPAIRPLDRNSADRPRKPS